MAINTISLILVFIEISLGAKIISGIFVLPYLLYLIERGERWVLTPISLIILIHSLQNERLSLVITGVIVISLIYFLLLNYMEYNREGIIVFSIIQSFILFVIYKNDLSFFNIMYNFIGLNLINYFYIVQLKGKSGKI